MKSQVFPNLVLLEGSDSTCQMALMEGIPSNASSIIAKMIFTHQVKSLDIGAPSQQCIQIARQ